MQENLISIRREDLSKKGEKRVAIVPELAAQIAQNNHRLFVQPAIHPVEGENKRAFPDTAYEAAGAKITEDLAEADVIFGLKEIELAHILPEKAYYFFSHTHKGQVKNRKLLRDLVTKKATLVDYELISNEKNERLITAFTYFAGYAGMIDSLWALGKRLDLQGITNPYSRIPQSIEKEDLALIKNLLKELAADISQNGTPASLPPFICGFLGRGKTSQGAQEMFDLLPVKEIALDELKDVFEKGSRKYVYKIQLEIGDMFRLKPESDLRNENLDNQEIIQHYFSNPDQFESNLDQAIPYVSLLMNCIIWSPRFPRLISREDARAWYRDHRSLQVIGDITCDPEGAIQFSKETWIDDPVFIYNPEKNTQELGFEGEGIAVMAVTNLPCEFAADASRQFSENLEPLLGGILKANYKAETVEKAGLPEAVEKATILWRGEFTSPYVYMEEYL